ncbi:hypothetical protein [Streptomyces sp. SCUT-3]|uniref:hypothetical protein n=1 Tax=Streptomyces sp. SCUT-3 TaxID=2684469 RepID=UPI0021756186|nr:hypothetical protein [Streptomyces sp. SCUT-3]
MDTELVRAWVEGWAVSRGAAPPAERAWGLTTDVGVPGHVTRHVLYRADEELVRDLTATNTAPGTWLKVFAPPETVSARAAPGWSLDVPCFLMSAPLRPAPVTVPDGYRLRTRARGGVVRTVVLAADGALAARGQIAFPAAGAAGISRNRPDGRRERPPRPSRPGGRDRRRAGGGRLRRGGRSGSHPGAA